MLSAASVSVIEWPMVKAVTMRTSCIQLPREQHQAEQEEQVVRADQICDGCPRVRTSR